VEDIKLDRPGDFMNSEENIQCCDVSTLAATAGQRVNSSRVPYRNCKRHP